MNEDKLLGLQMQVRQNQQELTDYVKELDGWGDEMKRKEQKLKLETHSCSEVSVILMYFFGCHNVIIIATVVHSSRRDVWSLWELSKKNISLLIVKKSRNIHHWNVEKNCNREP